MIRPVLFPFFAILMLLGSMTLSAASSDVERLHDIVDTKVHHITDILNDTTIAKPQKNEKIMNIAEEMIDFDIMAKLSLGKEGWQQLNSEQQHEFVTLFVVRIKNSYLEKLYLYNGQQVRIEPGEQVKNSRIEIPSFILTDEGEIEIRYKFYRTREGKWLIYDINLAGVSIVQSNRAQFAEFLSSASASDLLEKLRQDKQL
jgi:phospholipid transport system substrate-binding protein